MIVTVKRDTLTEKSTIGRMFIGDEFICYTLEDVVRPEGIKEYGKTAIPEGTYKMVIDYSTRFKKPMPHILDVPMFEGIRIHAGNTSEDVSGCLAIGYTKGIDFIGRSREAFNDFMIRLNSFLEEGDVNIKIQNNC